MLSASWFHRNLVAQESAPEEPKQPYVYSLGLSGMTSFAAGRWGALRATVVNPTDSNKVIRISAWIDGREQDQFGRDIQVPAHARITTSFPIWIPNPNEPTGPPENVDPYGASPSPGPSGSDVNNSTSSEIRFGRVDLKAWVSDVTGPTPIPLQARANEMQFELSATMEMPELRMGIVESVLPQRDVVHGMGMEAAVALRTTNRMSKRLQTFLPYEFPSDPAILDSFDQIVIAGPGLTADSRSTQAFREWILRGGRAWIMVDSVDLDWLSGLLQDSMSVVEADTTTLEQVRWHYELSTAMPDEVRDYEEPIAFRRCVVDGGNAEWTIDGWPAMVTHELGRGKVVLSFVGPRALVKPANQRDFGIEPPEFAGGNSLRADLYSSNFKLEEFLEKTAFTSMLGERGPQFPKPAAAAEYVGANISYKVPSKYIVFGALGVFCASITLVGLVVAKRERLRSMLYVTPLVSLLALVVLSAIGMVSRSSVSEVASELQLVRGEDGVDEIDVFTTGQVFVSTASARRIEASGAGVLMPRRSDSNVKLWQRLWTDHDSWNMPEVSIPVGMLNVDRHQSQTLDELVTIQATFDSEGLVGQLRWPGLQAASDAVLRGESRSLLAELSEDGSFRVSADREFAPGQYVAGATLSDEQQRRQSFLREFLVTERETRPRAMFYVWGSLREPGVSFEGVDRRSGSALYMAPLKLNSPAPNTPVRIPRGLMSVRTVQGVDGRAREGSTAYVWAKDEWVQLAAPAESTSTHYVTFRMPECLLPLQLDSVDVSMQVSADDLRIRLSGLDGDNKVELANEVSPRSTIRFQVTDPKLLELTELGEWVLVLEVDRLPETSMQANWKVESLEVDVRGTARVAEALAVE